MMNGETWWHLQSSKYRLFLQGGDKVVVCSSTNPSQNYWAGLSRRPWKIKRTCVVHRSGTSLLENVNDLWITTTPGVQPV
jgi:hypothetical protein